MSAASLWEAALVGAVDVLRARTTTALAADPYDGDAIAADALLAAANREIDRAVYRAAGAAGACAGPEGQLALGAAWQYADDVAAALARLERGIEQLTQDGRLDRAVGLLEQFAAMTPPRSPLFYALGLAREEAGDLSGAAVAYRQAMEATPTIAPPGLRLAQLVEERDPHDAAAALAHALAADSQQPQIWLRLGRLLHRIGDHHGARDAFAQSLRQDAGGALVEFELGELLIRMGRRHEAAERLRSAVALDPSLAEAHFELGALLESYDLEEAAESYRRAVAARPGYADAALRLGAALEQLGRLDEALITLRLGAAERPERAVEFVRLVLSTLLKKSDWLGAAQAALDGLRRAPDDAGFAYGRAGALVAAGRFGDAEACLQDFANHRIEACRSLPPIHLERLYLAANRMADAAAWRAAHGPTPEPARDWSLALAAGRATERTRHATAPQPAPGLSARQPLILTLGAAGTAEAVTLAIRFHLQQGCDGVIALDDRSDPDRRLALKGLAHELPVTVIDVPAQSLSAAEQTTLLVCVARDALGAEWALLGSVDAYWVAPNGGLKQALSAALAGPFADADLLLAQTLRIPGRRDRGVWPDGAFWSQIDVIERPWPRLDDHGADEAAPVADQTVRPHALCVRTERFRGVTPCVGPTPTADAILATDPQTGWFVAVETLRFAPGALAPWGSYDRPPPSRCVDAPIHQWMKASGRMQERLEIRSFVEQDQRIARRLAPTPDDLIAAAQRRAGGLLETHPWRS